MRRRDLSFGIVLGGTLQAVVPCEIVLARSKGIIRNHFLESLGGPAVAPGVAPETRSIVLRMAYRKLLELAREHRARTVDVRFPSTTFAPSDPAASDDVPEDFITVPASSWILRTEGRTEEELWRGMHKRSRNTITKAQRKRALVREANGRADVESYYQLHVETYRRTGVTPHPIEYFEAIWDDFVAESRAMMLIAEHDGVPCAAINVGIFREKANYWTGASSLMGRDLGANNLLLWEAVKRLRSRVSLFDFGDAADEEQSKSHSLSKFKESFGGDRIPYRRLRSVVEPSLILESARRIRRRTSR